MTQILFINGPSGSGKDTVSGFVKKCSPAHVCEEKLSWPLKSGLAHMFRLKPEFVEKLEKKKDIDQPLFNNRSWREMQIRLFRDYFLPTFGAEVFGTMLLNRIQIRENSGTQYRTYVISDCGKYEECMPIVNKFLPIRCRHAEITREGFDWGTDYRVPIALDGIDKETIENRFDLEIFEVQIRQMFGDWV